MVNTTTRTRAPFCARSIRVAVMAILCGIVSAHALAQSAKATMTPSWAEPIDDVSGQRAAPLNDTPMVSPARPSPITGNQAPSSAKLPATASLASSVAPSPMIDERSDLGRPVPAAPRASSQAPIAQSWTTGTNTSLRMVVLDWARRAGAKVIWQATTDRNIEAPLNFSGSFPEAVHGLFDLYGKTRKPLFVDSYPTQRPPLILVTEAN